MPAVEGRTGEKKGVWLREAERLSLPLRSFPNKQSALRLKKKKKKSSFTSVVSKLKGKKKCLDTAFPVCVLRQKTHICVKSGPCWKELAWLTPESLSPADSLKTECEYRLVNKLLRGCGIGESMSVISSVPEDRLRACELSSTLLPP